MPVEARPLSDGLRTLYSLKDLTQRRSPVDSDDAPAQEDPTCEAAKMPLWIAAACRPLVEPEAHVDVARPP